ncbi:MAG: retroviral-like aspartic protease family protein [Acidobacteriota bacterium]|nr:retroviral-like aspartic protease family protein [Acidobacteriota bacterium]
MTRTTLTAAAGILSLLLVPISARQQSITEPGALLASGDRLASEARFGEALEVYREALAGAPGAQHARAGAGVVTMLLRLAAFDEAHDVAVRLRDRLPGVASVLALSGEALWAAGLFEAAEADFDAALRLDPEEARAHDGLARSLAARAQFTAALAAADKAVSLAPQVPEFRHTLATIKERTNRFDEAAADLEVYAGLLPDSDRGEKAAWTRAQVKFLRSFRGRVPFQLAGGARSHTVKFRMSRDKVIVSGRVNGGREIDFVLDTGSEQTVLSRPIAERTGVRPITYVQSAGVGQVRMRTLQAARINTLEIGSLKIRNVPALIKSPALRGLPTPESESFSPLALGLSMTIDYGRRELTMAPSLPDETYDITLPLRMHRLAMVPGIVDGRQVSFVVDTGGEVISISTRTADTLAARPDVRQVPLKVYGSSGWDPKAFLRPYVDLSFAGVSYPNRSVVVLDLDAPSALLGFKLGGIVGHRFLRDYRVSIDLPRARLGLQTLD